MMSPMPRIAVASTIIAILAILFVAFIVLIVVVLVHWLRSGQPRNGPEKNAGGFAENIKALRCRLNFSQEYVAEKMGVSRQAVSKWETGASEPSTANLRALAQLYDVSIDDLINSR